ncbi:MAG: 2OG-Fe(II) oxygenase [Myxococcota bacterium]
MCEVLLGSPLVGKSPLVGTFAASRGFSLVFTADAVDEVRRRFPVLGTFLNCALAPNVRASLVSRWDRLLGQSAVPPPNAFYLNLLLLRHGSGVGPHIDATLREESGVEDAIPELVTVLYLRTPASGGVLRLREGRRHIADIQPSPGALLAFAGHLTHEVLPVDGEPDDGPRASLVCEQYHLPATGVARLPRCRVHTMADF